MESKIKAERVKTAEFRFYLVILKSTQQDKWRFIVCDRSLESKTIAKFSDKLNGDLFLQARRAAYVETGE